MKQKSKFYCKKRFGQNFLIDPAIIRKIIAAINVQPHQNLIEVGPGLGVITELFLKQCAKLIAIEIDNDLINSLTKKFHDDLQINRLILLNQDVLQVDFIDLFKQYFILACTDNKPRIVGNLPYNISTPLLFKIFDCASRVEDLHFLLQKEVAQRLVAMPGSRQYGRLSVMAQYHVKMDIIFFIPPQSFKPVPKVDSAMVRFVPHTKLPIVASDYQHFHTMVVSAFSQKRKILVNSLKKYCNAKTLELLGINPMVRPEQVSVVDFVKISNFLVEK